MSSTQRQGAYCSQPDHLVEASRNVILRAEVGSTVYGTGLPGHEDHDEMAVYVMSPEHVLGTSPCDSIVWRTAGASERSTPDDTDLAMYSARKYVTLAAAGNPSILVPLFAPLDKVFECSRAGVMLLRSVDLFVTKQTGHRFLGYMEAQRKRMVDSHAGTRAPRSNRPELVAEHGYDTKFAMHMLRLGLHGHELLTTGTLVFPIPDPQGEYLRSVRRGEYTYEEVIGTALDLKADLEDVLKRDDIPSRPDRGMVDRLLWDIHRSHWGV